MKVKQELYRRALAEVLLTPLRRCSICQIRNKYKEASAAWSVRRCIEVINNELKKEQP